MILEIREQMPIDYGNLILSGLLAAVVSAIVTWFSGDRWVDINNRRKEHSIKIITGFKEWSESPDDLSPIGIKLNNVNKIVGFPKKNFESLSYHKDLEKHLNSGYPELKIKWENYQKKISDYNKQLADIQNVVLSLFIKIAEQNMVSVVFPLSKQKNPIYYVNAWNIVQGIQTEFESILNGYQEWYQGTPLSSNVQSGNDQYIMLNFRNFTLASHPSIDFIDTIRDEIIRIVEDQEIYDEMYRLHEIKYNNHMLKLEFVKELDRIIEVVELGHELKGSCDTCISRWQL